MIISVIISFSIFLFSFSFIISLIPLQSCNIDKSNLLTHRSKLGGRVKRELVSVIRAEFVKFGVTEGTNVQPISPNEVGRIDTKH